MNCRVDLLFVIPLYNESPMNYRGVANDQSESAIMPLRKSRDPVISYPKQVTFDEYSMLLVLYYRRMPLASLGARHAQICSGVEQYHLTVTVRDKIL